jgi:hypothetical protein
MASLDARLRRAEQALTPPRVFISLSQYPCESDTSIHQRVERVLGRQTRQGDVVFVVRLQAWGEVCPDGPHTHPEDAQVWQEHSSLMKGRRA